MSNMQSSWNGVIFVQSCGGSLINTRTVLSAAHCYEFTSSHHVFSSTMRSSGGETYLVSKIIHHPEYSVKVFLDADVAVLHLASTAVLSSKVATIPIVSANYQLNHGLPVTAIGWGNTEFGGSPSEVLQHVQVYIIDQQICAERYGNSIITPGMACAGILDVGGKDACQQDSGGPYIFQGSPNILVGITSWGQQCALPNFPGVIVRVTEYTNWITANAY